MEVLVINRDRDTDRLTGFLAAARAHGIEPRRLPAIDAHAPGFDPTAWRDLIGDHFWGGQEIKPGAVGCYLSHRTAWASVAEGAASVLVCEDDARLAGPLDGLARTATEVPGFDILFANDRLAGWAGLTGHDPCRLEAAVLAVDAAGGPKAAGLKAAPGGDCYLLSPEGARRLLEISAAQRITCGVDWAMVWAGLGPAGREATAIPEIATLAAHAPPVDPPLGIWIAGTPAARLDRSHKSVLGHAVRMTITEFLGG